MKHLILILLFATFASHAELIRKEYNGFTVWVDCDRGGAQVAYYRATVDTANHGRSSGFKFDTSVPPECQPRSIETYRNNTVPANTGYYDIGHLVPANHLDYSKQSVADSFYVTNTLPQQSSFNRYGAWAYTEKLTECYRDMGNLDVWAGVLWGNNSSDDFFLNTHGIATPDYWWKVVIWMETGEYVAWIMPNNKASKAGKINSYLVSIEELANAGAYLPNFEYVIPPQMISVRPSSSWPVKQAGNQMLECGDGFRTHMG